MATLVLTDIQKASLAIAPKDAAGNAAPVQGAPAWASSDESVLTVTPAADGMSADITTTGALGTAQVSVTADADLGDGVTTITGTLDVIVEASQAVSIVVVTGAPEPR